MRFRTHGGDALARKDDDPRRRRPLHDAVQGPGLAGSANRFVVHVVRGRSARIEVRSEPHPSPAFGKAREGERELRQQSQHGGSSRQEWALGVKWFVAHQYVAYGRSCFYASQRLAATIR
jgi:hypothetical protein